MRCVASDVRIHQAQLNVQRATTLQATTGGDNGHRNRWSTVVTSVDPATSIINESTATTSTSLLVQGETKSQPVRKSPRLQERYDDDEVVEVPPPPKVYTVVDLTGEGTETADIMELNATTQLQTPRRRRGRPCKVRSQTREADNNTSKPSQNA
jgi:hypothetical protein